MCFCRTREEYWCYYRTREEYWCFCRTRGVLACFCIPPLGILSRLVRDGGGADGAREGGRDGVGFAVNTDVSLGVGVTDLDDLLHARGAHHVRVRVEPDLVDDGAVALQNHEGTVHHAPWATWAEGGQG